jgi:hypothetical protein
MRDDKRRSARHGLVNVGRVWAALRGLRLARRSGGPQALARDLALPLALSLLAQTDRACFGRSSGP